MPSDLIARKYEAELSPATVRNEMAALEEAGLIAHPHTSAGRVPTDRGYRVFVDLLLESRKPTPPAAIVERRAPSLAATLLHRRGIVPVPNASPQCTR